MQPAHQQALAQHPVAAPASVKCEAAPPQKSAGYCRWIAVIISVLLLLGCSAVIMIVNPLFMEQMLPEDANSDPNPVGILRRQFQTYRPKAQRLPIHASLGQTFLSTGHLSMAAMHFTEVVELAKSKAEKAEARRMLGLTRMRQGRLWDAHALLEDALTSMEEDTSIGVLHTLADIKMELGRVKQALKLYNEAFNLADRIQDFDRGSLLAAAIGEAWASKGHLQESLTWFDTAMQLQDTLRTSPAGVDEATAAKVLSILGFVRHRSGGILAAMELYRKALRAQTKILHPSNPDIVSTWLGLARAQRDLGDAGSALRDLQALERTLREGPQEGLELSRVLILKSDTLRELTHSGEAVHAIHEAMQLQGKLLNGEDHPEVGIAARSHGSILHDARELNSAHEKYKVALEISVRMMGEKHPTTASAHNSLGTLHQDLGDDSTARDHFAKCLQIQLATFGQDGPDVATTYNNLATVHFRQGQRTDALEMLQKALDLLDRAGVPQDNPDRRLYQENLELVKSAAE